MESAKRPKNDKDDGTIRNVTNMTPIDETVELVNLATV